MKRLEVSGAVRPLYGSLGVRGLTGIRSPETRTKGHTLRLTCRSWIKLLAPELFFLILAHPVYKM